MKIVKHGETIPFLCVNCGCLFVVGKHNARLNDGNYYHDCPECGCNCHTDISRLEALRKEVADVQGCED